MKVFFVTHGCKANQYDTEAFRQELESLGARVAATIEDADACVINTCTVTNSADAEARKAIRRARRQNPDVQVFVAGCSAALRAKEYSEMPEVTGVAPGQDPLAVASLIASESLADRDEEPIGGELLAKNISRTRGWLKIQDGCDRRCSFCATRLARGISRSRTPDEIISEANLLSATHRELVLTGIHIGHYGLDLNERGGPKDHSLSGLVSRLVEEVPQTRFRLGSIEATEIDDALVDVMVNSSGRLVPHLHVPMQSGSDTVLRRMRRWHSREDYRSRVLEIAEQLPYLGLGADIIVGFPGETDEEFEETRALVEELPYSYLHVFPYSERDGTLAAGLPDKVDHAVKTARSKLLRELAAEKGRVYRQSRNGLAAEIVVEEHSIGLTEDYLRVRIDGTPTTGDVVYAPLCWQDDELVASV